MRAAAAESERRQLGAVRGSHHSSSAPAKPINFKAYERPQLPSARAQQPPPLVGAPAPAAAAAAPGAHPPALRGPSLLCGALKAGHNLLCVVHVGSSAPGRSLKRVCLPGSQTSANSWLMAGIHAGMDGACCASM